MDHEVAKGERAHPLLWGGRFTDTKVDPLMVQFNESFFIVFI